MSNKNLYSHMVRLAYEAPEYRNLILPHLVGFSKQGSESGRAFEAKMIRLAYADPRYRSLVIPHFKMRLGGGEQALTEIYSSQTFDIGTGNEIKITTVLSYASDKNSPYQPQAVKLLAQLKKTAIKDKAKEAAKSVSERAIEGAKEGAKSLGRTILDKAGMGAESIGNKLLSKNPMQSFAGVMKEGWEVTMGAAGEIHKEFLANWEKNNQAQDLKDSRARQKGLLPPKKMSDHLKRGGEIAARSVGVVAMQVGTVGVGLGLSAVAGAVAASGRR